MSNCQVCEATTDGFLCRPCLEPVERAIGDMGSLMHELSVKATKQANVYRANGQQRPPVDHSDPEKHLPAYLRSPHGRTALRPTTLPVDLDASELLWVTGSTLSTWTRHLATSRGVPLPSADEMIGWLLTNLEAVRFDEAAEQIHDEITSLHGTVERAVDRSPSRLFAGPCHREHYDEDDDGKVYEWRCERDLYAVAGRYEIVCDGFRVAPGDVGCRAVHTAIERRDWLLAEIEDRLLPLDLLLDAIGSLMPQAEIPPRPTWRTWRSPKRQRLVARSVDRMGVELFRGGDVVELVRQANERRQSA